METNSASPAKGWRTSEFWLQIVAFIVSTILAAGFITNQIALQILGMVVSALGALGYTGARSYLKARTAQVYNANEKHSIRTSIQHD